jgi:hypothetical protein
MRGLEQCRRVLDPAWTCSSGGLERCEIAPGGSP